MTEDAAQWLSELPRRERRRLIRQATGVGSQVKGGAIRRVLHGAR